MNNNIKRLAKEFNLLILDTETTGLDFKNDKIIDLGVCKVDDDEKILEAVNSLIKIPEGEYLSQKITDLTHITNQMLRENGEDKKAVESKFIELMNNSDKPTLIVAYNAHFDASFILNYFNLTSLKNNMYWLDAMTLYKEVAPYPHRLETAIEFYNLGEKCVNSHRAYDDAYACLLVLDENTKDRNYSEVLKHINVFGFNPKYIPQEKAYYFENGTKQNVVYVPQSASGGQNVLDERYYSKRI